MEETLAVEGIPRRFVVFEITHHDITATEAYFSDAMLVGVENANLCARQGITDLVKLCLGKFLERGGGRSLAEAVHPDHRHIKFGEEIPRRLAERSGSKEKLINVFEAQLLLNTLQHQELGKSEAKWGQVTLLLCFSILKSSVFCPFKKLLVCRRLLAHFHFDITLPFFVNPWHRNKLSRPDDLKKLMNPRHHDLRLTKADLNRPPRNKQP